MAKRKMRKKVILGRRKIFFGFTLIELLIVIGILSILLSITLIAISPYEQLSRAVDTKARASAREFVNSTVSYYASNKELPWQNNSACNTELSSNGTLADMPSCLGEIIKGDKLEEQYLSGDELKHIYISKCGTSAVLCYDPKSKVESEDGETKYTKFGVNQPGCPGANGSGDCYWCKPVFNTSDCNIDISPTPTTIPPSTVPTSIPATPTSVQVAIPRTLPNYANDQTKFFKTYAVYFFDYPGFGPPSGGWDLHLSVNSDFSGDYTQTNLSFGIPSQYGPGGTNTSYIAYQEITHKYVGFASTPSNTGPYSLSNCGRTLYYRIANYYNPSAPDKQVGPTYTATFDCTTHVGVVDPPLSWYTVYDQVNGRQKQYDASWDFDNNGQIDWVDYWLGAFSTKTRYGGWQPPE